MAHNHLSAWAGHAAEEKRVRLLVSKRTMMVFEVGHEARIKKVVGRFPSSLGARVAGPEDEEFEVIFEAVS